MSGDVVALTTKHQQGLVLSVLRLIERKVNDLAPWARAEEREDLVGAARVGATLAATRFSSSYGARFTSYATPYICGAIKDHLTSERRQRGALFHAASLSGREFMAEQSDTFKVLWDDAETNRGKLETLAERLLAAMFAGVAGAALANPEEVVLDQGGTERAVGNRSRGGRQESRDRAPHLHDAVRGAAAARRDRQGARRRREHRAASSRGAARPHRGPPP